MYGWEVSFNKMIEKIRCNELNILYKMCIYDLFLATSIELIGVLVKSIFYYLFKM